jgi:hypothetical protein
MREKESNSGFGIIFMFIGGLLTIIAGVLLGIVQVGSSLLTIPSDEVLILQMLLIFGILFDIMGIYFYGSTFYTKETKTDTPHAVSKRD